MRWVNNMVVCHKLVLNKTSSETISIFGKKNKLVQHRISFRWHQNLIFSTRPKSAATSFDPRRRDRSFQKPSDTAGFECFGRFGSRGRSGLCGGRPFSQSIQIELSKRAEAKKSSHSVKKEFGWWDRSKIRSDPCFWQVFRYFGWVSELAKLVLSPDCPIVCSVSWHLIVSYFIPWLQDCSRRNNLIAKRQCV